MSWLVLSLDRVTVHYQRLLNLDYESVLVIDLLPLDEPLRSPLERVVHRLIPVGGPVYRNK
jgi:hypothetical protein